MDLSPRVTILINNYNYGRFLREAIDSALNQTYANCEVVVVDDGSTDDSKEILASYGIRIRTVLKTNGGQGSAYNAGFVAASGDIIMFLDADDWLKPEAAARIVSVWGDGVQMVHHRLAIVDAQGKALGHWPQMPLKLDEGDVTPILLRTGFIRCLRHLVWLMDATCWKNLSLSRKRIIESAPTPA